MRELYSFKIMTILEETVLKIKENPNKYIGKKSLNRLNLFLLGYNLNLADQDGTNSDWLRDFQSFIQQKYHIKHCIGFSEIIRCFSSSDAHAFDRFYELLEEYYIKKKEEFS